MVKLLVEECWSWGKEEKKKKVVSWGGNQVGWCGWERVWFCAPELQACGKSAAKKEREQYVPSHAAREEDSYCAADVNSNGR